MAEKSDGCCCCVRKRRQRVGPSPVDLKDIIEIRPHRRLRVRHINCRPRDNGFEKELKVYLESIRNVPDKPRVVTIPRLNVRRSVELSKEMNSIRSDTNQHSTANSHSHNLPNMTAHPGNKNQEDLKPGNNSSKMDELLPYSRPLSEKEALHSESRASFLSNDERSIMSASSVHVAMDLYGRKAEKDKTANVHSVIAETDESLSSRSDQNIAMHNGLPPSKFSAVRQNNSNNQGQKDSFNTNIPRSNLSPRKSNVANGSQNKQKIIQKSVDKDIVLFFIHGVGGSSDIWTAQLDWFTKLGCEIVCLDLIGHGLSDAPDKKSAYTFDQILIDITEIFDKYCKRKNVLVGHSYGCAFATVIAKERRKWMSKLILVSGGGPTPLAPQPGVFSLPICLLACLRTCLNSGFHRGAFHPKYKNDKDRRRAFDVPTYVLSNIMNGQYWPDGDDLYHSWISVPTLLVYGRHDGLVDLTEEEDMLKVIYGSHLEIVEDAGHMVMMEAPDKFNQLLHNFITDQPLGTEHFVPDTSLTDDEYLQTTHRNLVKSEASLHSVRSCKSTKSMPHGLLASSRSHVHNS